MKMIQYQLDRGEVLELRQGATVEARRLGEYTWRKTTTTTLKDAAKGLLLCMTCADAFVKLGRSIARPDMGYAVQFQSTRTDLVAFADWCSHDNDATLASTTYPDEVAFWPTHDLAVAWLETVGLLPLEPLPRKLGHATTAIRPLSLEGLAELGPLVSGPTFEVDPMIVHEMRRVLARRLEEGRKVLDDCPRSVWTLPKAFAPSQGRLF